MINGFSGKINDKLVCGLQRGLLGLVWKPLHSVSAAWINWFRSSKNNKLLLRLDWLHLTKHSFAFIWDSVSRLMWESYFSSCVSDIMEEPPLNELEDVVDFIKGTISRLRRASSSTAPSPTFSSATPSPSKDGSNSRTRRRRGRKKGASQEGDKRGRGTPGKGETDREFRGAGGGRRRGQGCVLKQIHLNVTDLGLGYRSSEEMIFRYCSGPCRKFETNYDKILQNLAHNRRFPSREAPPQACCRPIAFDDDLSFLDDNLVYHTVRKHSARKCGCV